MIVSRRHLIHSLSGRLVNRFPQTLAGITSPLVTSAKHGGR
jgi:hypothetical protein